MILKNHTLHCWSFCRFYCRFHAHIMRQYERQITGSKPSPILPANLYRKYLSEVRGQKELSFEDLTAYIGKWRTLKDSVTAAMHRDTAYRTHSDIREECILLHDSVRSELSRLAMSKPRTYKEVLVLKERFSPYAGDVELCRSAERDPSVFRRTG